LNVSKPPNLLRLYRDFKRHVVPTKLTFQQAVQTLPDEEFQNLVKKVQDLEGQIEVMRQLTSEQIEIIDHLRQQLTEAQLKSEQLEKSLTDLNRNVDKVTAEIASIDSFETLEATEQFCRESIPQTFFDFMFEKCCAEIPSNNNLSILCEGSFDKVITLLSLR
jgi:predicted  nucleic acid-binding Zn-ribbon protein